MNYTIIGEQIQKYRKAAQLTQKELGEALGISSSAVSRWETGGTPDISLLPAIAGRGERIPLLDYENRAKAGFAGGLAGKGSSYAQIYEKTISAVAGSIGRQRHQEYHRTGFCRPCISSDWFALVLISLLWVLPDSAPAL